MLALEHILKLHNGVWPGKVAFCSAFIEFGYCLISGDVDSVFAIIHVDFNAAFVTRIVALQLVTFK